MSWLAASISSSTLLCIFYIAFPSEVFSQRIIPRFETLSVDDGLSQNSVYSILQDKNGFMWFGTSNGLNRYDGENIKVFKIKSPSLEKANVNFVRGNLCEDKSGRIWYVNETGVYYFDPLKEEIIRGHDFMQDNSTAINYYASIALDDNGDLWLSSSFSELLKFSTSNKQLQRIPLPKEISDTDHIKYGSKEGNALFLFFFKQGANYKFDLSSYAFEKVTPPTGNGIIRSDGEQSYLIDKNKFSMIDSLQSKTMKSIDVQGDINRILKDPFGRIWISAVSAGLFCYYPVENKVENYQHENSKLKSLPFDVTTCFYIDNTNNLWIGTDGGGVARLDLKPSQFEIFPLNQGDHPMLSDYFTTCLLEDDRGRIWFGTFHNGLCIYNPADGSLLNYSHQPEDGNSIPSNKVNFILQGNDHTMWISHSKGLSIFDEQKNKFISIDLKSPSPQTPIVEIMRLKQFKNNDIMMCSASGVFLIRKNKNKYKPDYWNEFDVVATDIQQLPNGDIWTTSREQGLNHFKHNGTAYEKKETFFSGVNLRSIHIDEQDPELIWICSGAGLIRFNIKSHDYKLYNNENGMPDNYLYGILEDRHHNFWMSSNTGLYFFDKKEEKFVNHSIKEGLQSNEFNARAFHKGASGKFYFGGINGFNYFDPGVTHSQLTTPKASVTDVFINDKHFVKDSSWTKNASLTLNHFENDLAFTFAVLDYSHPQANQLQYKLEGWDKEFITTSVKNVRYSNLLPGDYTLRLRGSNNGQIWGKEENLHMYIQAPFWKTNLFYGGIMIMLVGGVVTTTQSYYRRKVNRKLRELEKQQAVLQERERISKDIHDDLGAGLSTIAILSELVKRNATQDDVTEKQLHKISESSRRLIENLGELIWAHNPTNDSLLKLLWYLREHLSGLFEGTSITFQIVIPDDISDRPIQVEWRRNIFLITKEALHNALKHSHATKVDLMVSVIEDKLIINVCDNGVGFNVEEKKDKGNGMSNMEKRAMACSAELRIESYPGKGTVLVVSALLV